MKVSHFEKATIKFQIYFYRKNPQGSLLKEAIEKYKIPFDQIKGIQNGADWFDSHGKVINNDQITIANSKSKSIFLY